MYICIHVHVPKKESYAVYVLVIWLSIVFTLFYIASMRSLHTHCYTYVYIYNQCTYTYTYIHMYICVSVHKRNRICDYIDIVIHNVYICTDESYIMYIYKYIYTCMCIYIFIHIYIYVCDSRCVCEWLSQKRRHLNILGMYVCK